MAAPATATPTGMSVPALSLASSTAKPAWTTMKLVAWCSRARRDTDGGVLRASARSLCRRGCPERTGRAGPWAAQRVRGYAGQGVFPYRGAQRCCSAGIGQITQVCALPQRVIDVLNRQRSPGWRPPGASTAVSRIEVSTSGASDQPSAAMWCTVSTNKWSWSATRNRLAYNGICVAKSNPRRAWVLTACSSSPEASWSLR